MFKPTVLVVLILLFSKGYTQQVSLPADLRQHTLTQYNASLFNPAFSLDRNNPQSVSFWTRWQWQAIDTDPTTLFLNYTRSLNEDSAAGLGFFQHNTGIYFNTGGALNYAYQIEFNRLIKLSIGANAFAFQQQIADTRFQINPIPGIPQTIPQDDFILQVATGINIQVENFSLGLASENLFDYNFTDKVTNTVKADKIFMGMASYDFPVMASDSTAFVRPSLYLRTIPEQKNQIGMNIQFNTSKYWIQSGYNNFYGISVGAGGTFFNRFSLGALVEFGNKASLNKKNPSFEFIASYYLGQKEERRPLVASGVLEPNQQVVIIGKDLENEKIKEELENAEKLANGGSIDVEESNLPIEVQPKEESKEEIKAAKKEARRLAAEQKAKENQYRKDSIALVKKEKADLALLKKQERELARKAEEEAKFKADEAERIKAAKKLAEAEKLVEQNRIAQAAKVAEQERIAAAEKLAEEERIASAKRLAEEEKIKKAEKLAEQLRNEEAKKLAEKERQAAAERLAEEERLKEAKKLADQKRIKEANKLAEQERLAEAERLKEQRRLEAIAKENEEKAKAKRLAEQRKQDSIDADRKARLIIAERNLKELQRLDSISRAKKLDPVETDIVEENVIVPDVPIQVEPEVIELAKGEKYEEVDTVDGMEPGFYLIANVFRTKKYFDIFMSELRNKGLQPKSFYRSLNNYNYAYLERYNTMREARIARDSNFNGNYDGKIWIYRVVAK